VSQPTTLPRAPNGFTAVSPYLKITHEVFFAPSHSFLANFSSLPTCQLRNLGPILVIVTLEPRTHRKHHFLYCCEGVFSGSLHSNGSYSIAAGICLPSSCLAMDVSSDFTFPAFGHHVTIILLHNESPKTTTFLYIPFPTCKNNQVWPLQGLFYYRNIPLLRLVVVSISPHFGCHRQFHYNLSIYFWNQVTTMTPP
jgi:hypothetical protein